jgi:hypothetical protein
MRTVCVPKYSLVMTSPKIAALALGAGILCVPAMELTPPSNHWHWLQVDSAEIQIAKVDSIARWLGMKRVPSAMDRPLKYRGTVSAFQFAIARPGYSERSGTWDSTWAVAFNTGGPLETFLASAYLQEVRPAFRDSFPGFRDYREIGLSGFHRRLWWSTGYAAQYALRDNSMVPAWQKNFLVANGYVVDGIAAIAVASAAWPNASPEQRLSAALFAAGFTAFERLLLWPIGYFSIRQHNAVVRSGYRIPDFSSDTKTPSAAPR